MKNILFRLCRIAIVCAMIQPVTAAPENLALSFNGKDDQVDLYMAPLLEGWTVTAWVKKEGPWGKVETILGCGWITLSSWENYPLVFTDGKLCVHRSGVSAPEVFPPGWHHVASSWDGKKTTLYIDGEAVATAPGGRPMCPAFMGSSDGKEYFRGQIDEVSIWNRAIPKKILREWMNRPLDSSHPHHKNLVAYFPFDDGARDVTDYRNDNKADRKRYYKSPSKHDGPRYQPAENPAFTPSASAMRLLSAEAMQTSFEIRPGQRDVEILKLRIRCEGNANPVSIDSLELDFSASTDLSEIAAVRVHHLGVNAELDTSTPVYQVRGKAGKTITFHNPDAVPLARGVHYLAVLIDVKETAKPGHRIHAVCRKLTASGKTIEPIPVANPSGKLIADPAPKPNRLTVLNWNIWHGGIEKGRETGPAEIVEIIRESGADVVTMVETYSYGESIAKTLGFEFYEPYPNSNLSILSRFPITETYKSAYNNFNSTGAKVRMPNGREVLVWNVWLRYWPGQYVLEQYTRDYATRDQWIAGDEKTALEDIRAIFEKDLSRFDDGSLPVILSGDFNSCSHLDFTERAAAAGLHMGWVVDFPTHKEVIGRGYRDSYREANPDESTHHGGTWAALYRKWCEDFRIDFIYSKGDAVKTVRSRTIGEHVHADVLWPGDHSAVLSEFVISPAP